MKHSVRVFAVGTVLAGALAMSAGSAAAAAKGAAYFKGKTVTWVVATSPGGGHDFWGRLLSKYMGQKLSAKFVVKNRPGAGHIIGVNLINKSKPNGLTLGNFTTGLIFSQILKKKGIRFDLAKLSWLGKLSSEPRTMTTGKKSKLMNFTDVLNSKRKLKFSASGVGSGSYTDAFMIATAFSIPHRIITGYSGSQASLALLRGEVDLLMGSEDSAASYARAGQVRVIMQVGGQIKGVQDARKFAQTQETKDILKLMASMGNLSRIAAGPPKIPTDRLKALRAAFRGSVENKAFQDAASRAGRKTRPAYGDDVRKMVVDLLNQPPKIVALLNTMANIKVAMVKHSGKVTKTKRGGRRISIMYKGKEVKTKVSGSRTTVIINGKSGVRKNVKPGMTCTFTYPGPGKEAKRVDCKG
jgi:tripartite-type tricarboxylate transporter receptor subunit TctC